MLDSVYINWTVNGMLQTPFHYKTALISGNTASVTVGSVNMIPGVKYDIIAWTSSPNGGIDENLSNDTAEAAGIEPALNGVYSVGVTGDYTSLVAVANDLNTIGICGPVVFNVDPSSGPYEGRIELDSIKGVSAINTVIFNGNGAVVTDTTTSSVLHLVLVNGAKYVTFDSLELVCRGVNYGYGMLLTNQANFITVRNCTVDMTAITSDTASNSAGIVASASLTSNRDLGNNANHCLFEGNLIKGGATGLYYGIMLSGNTGNASSQGNIIP